MIPMTLKWSPVARRQEYTFRCVHCHGVFYAREKRTGNKKYCVECGEQARLAKERAQRHVKNAIKAGKILPATSYECWDCGKPADRYDHRNYDKPLDVQPVCCACNGRRGPAKWGTNGTE